MLKSIESKLRKECVLMPKQQLDKIIILNYLKEHFSEFRDRYQVEKIGLFGSYAKGNATQDSDIDIFVKMKPSLFGMVAIKEHIEHDLDRKVDIIREHKNIKPVFLQIIQKDLIYV
ncbi:MAG: nucleotidyltransferase domain-containing protein [Sulfurospirillaceae bacterium]|nr:nucleotidyltransferase domain-containing protein [Sulfurospirillaceae bacterium]